MNWFWFLNFYIKISKRHVYTLYAHGSTRALLLYARSDPVKCPRSSKADPGPARRARAPLKIVGGLFFINFDCITRIYFHCSQHTVLAICNLFSTVTNKHRVRVKVSSKQTPDPKNSGTAPYLDPPRSSISRTPSNSVKIGSVTTYMYTWHRRRNRAEKIPPHPPPLLICFPH